MTPEIFARRLIDTATTFVGLVETEQNAAFNDPARSRQIVKAMKRVAWWTPKAAYCAAADGAFVVLTAEGLGLDPSGFLKHWTAHCMTNVRTMRALGLLCADPVPGALWLARGAKDSGHAGLVIEPRAAIMSTVEGNTMSGNAGDQRQGDGFYARIRNVRTNGPLQTQGFVHPAAILHLMGQPKPTTTPATAKAPKTPERPIVRVQEYLETRGHARLVPKAVRQRWSHYDRALGYSVAAAEDISHWLAANL